MSGDILRAVTFDVDGTLTDAHRLRWPMFWRNVTRLRALRVGMQVREELRTRSFETGAALREHEARVVAERLDLDEARARALLDDIFDRSLVSALTGHTAAPALRQAIAALVDAGLRIGVVSDRRIDDKLVALGLHDLPWGARVSADDTGRLKPDPRTLELAAAALGVQPFEIAHVGDRDDTDGHAARNAGARYVHVTGPSDVPAKLRQLRSGGRPPPTGS